MADAAGLVIPGPASGQIDIDVFWSSVRSLRADVDNVAKPILDALKGILYVDDKQVRGLRVVAFPKDLPFKTIGPWKPDIFSRILKGEEFFVRVWVGLSLPY